MAVKTCEKAFFAEAELGTSLLFLSCCWGGPHALQGCGLSPQGGLAPASTEKSTATEQKQEQTRQTEEGGPQPEYPPPTKQTNREVRAGQSLEDTGLVPASQIIGVPAYPPT